MSLFERFIICSPKELKKFSSDAAKQTGSLAVKFPAGGVYNEG